MDAVALRRRQVDLDLGRELVLAGEQERAIRLGVTTGACVGEAEVADRATLARIERAAGLERVDRTLGIAQLQVHEAEVQPVRGVGRRLLDERLVDRLRLGELVAAEVRQAEQREHARVAGLELEGAAERALRLVELALLEQVAAAHDRLVQSLAALRGSHHQVIEPQRLAAVTDRRRRNVRR